MMYLFEIVYKNGSKAPIFLKDDELNEQIRWCELNIKSNNTVLSYHYIQFDKKFFMNFLSELIGE